MQPDRDDRRGGSRELHRQRRLGLQLHHRGAVSEGLCRLSRRHSERRQHPGCGCALATTAARPPHWTAPAAMRRPEPWAPTQEVTSRERCPAYDLEPRYRPRSGGMDPKPCLWPDPQMRLTYTKPATAATATDVWNSQCPSLPTAAGAPSPRRPVRRRPIDEGHRRRSRHARLLGVPEHDVVRRARSPRPMRPACRSRLHAGTSTCRRPTPRPAFARSTATSTAARCQPRP